MASKEVLKKIVSEGKIYSLENLHNVILDMQPDIVLFLASNITSLKAIKTCIDNNIKIGIANKESIIAGGEILFEGKELLNDVIPIDSETSGIFQAIVGEKLQNIKKIIITASGGPLFGRKKEELTNIAISDILKHPNWKMGSKITVDSATFVNKAFEIIETHFLSICPIQKLMQLFHRESIVHAIIEFIDNQMKAVLSIPDMNFHIQYALTYPKDMKMLSSHSIYLRYKNFLFMKLIMSFFLYLILL